MMTAPSLLEAQQLTALALRQQEHAGILMLLSLQAWASQPALDVMACFQQAAYTAA